MTAPAAPFRILVVCTGNICRSPLAAQLLERRLDDRFEVSSAGTFAETGSPMEALSVELSREYGGLPDDHRAQDLTPSLIDSADLVLTATREHRAAVVSMLPTASRRTFTLEQFARLVDHTVATVPRAELSAPAGLLAAVALARGEVPRPAEADDDDIEDPYRRSRETHERVAAQIDDACARIASALEAAR